MPALFAITLFVSATLLFMVQPMVGKKILPLLGGSPAAWNTCMVFFQGFLLLGYLYAHNLTSKYGPLRQTFVHLLVLAATVVGMLALSLISPDNSPVAVFKVLAPQGQSYPMFGVMALLFVAIGLPFLVVSTSAPLLQRWFNLTGHPSAKDPYFLYAASNAGSLISLLGYPLIVEPSLSLASQAWIWGIGFVILSGLIYLCGKALNDPLRTQAKIKADAAAVNLPASLLNPVEPKWSDRVRWMALAFVPSSLMLGVTFHMTTDIASVPLLWVIPLALYLLTFIIAYARTPSWFRPVLGNLSPVLTLLLVFVLVSNVTAKMPTFYALLLHLVVYFFTALLMHNELARMRPHPKFLTNYFLWISLGGVLGGIFNALIAPVLLPQSYEYPIAIAIGCLLVPTLNEATPTTPEASARKGLSIFLDALIPIGMIALVAGLTVAPEQLSWFNKACEWTARTLTDGFEAIGVDALVPGDVILILVIYALPCMVCFFFIDRPIRFGLCVGAVLFVCYFRASQVGTVEDAERSFFGILRVEKYNDPKYIPYYFQDEKGEWNRGIIVQKHEFRRLYHGTTLHGIQAAESSPNPLKDELQFFNSGSGWDTLVILGAQKSYDFRQEPLTYYHRTGPVGEAFHRARAIDAKADIAMVGLGTGSASCYALPGQSLTFYEIDPTVQKMVEGDKYFSYVTDARKRGAQVDIILGDARINLEPPSDPSKKQPHHDRKFGILLLDAFSSDSIPVHLLTKESVTLYKSRLTEHGLLAIHISNRYIDLEPVVERLADECGLKARVWSDNNEAGYPGKTASSWVVLAKSWDDLGLNLTGDDFSEKVDGKEIEYYGTDSHHGALAGGFGWRFYSHHWKPLKEFKEMRTWTDDYSDVLAVMRLEQIRAIRKFFGLPVLEDKKDK